MNYLKKSIKLILQLSVTILSVIILALCLITYLSWNKEINITKIVKVLAFGYSLENRPKFSDCKIKFNSADSHYNISLSNLKIEYSPIILETKDLNLSLKLQNVFSKKSIVQNFSLNDYNLYFSMVMTPSKENQLNHIDVLLYKYTNFIHNLHKITINLKSGKIYIIRNNKTENLKINDISIQTQTKNFHAKFLIGASEISLTSHSDKFLTESTLSINNLLLSDFINLFPEEKFSKLISKGEPKLSLNIDSKFNHKTEEANSFIDFELNNNSNIDSFIISKSTGKIFIEKKNRQIDFKNIMINFNNGGKAEFSSHLLLNQHKALSKCSVDWKISKLQISEIMSYWPENYEPEVKKWIDESIISGEVNNLQGQVSIGNSFVTKASGTIESVEVNYIKTHSNIFASKVALYFDENHLTAKTENARLANGISIASLSLDLPYNTDPIKIETTTKGEVKNYLFFIPEATFLQMQNEGFDLSKLKGTLNTQAVINIFQADVQKLSDIKFNIKAISDKELFYDQTFLSETNINIANNEEDIEVKFNGKVSGVETNFVYDSTKEKTLQGTVKINNSSLQKFKIDEFIKNENEQNLINLDFYYDKGVFFFNGDLTEQAILFKILSYKSPAAKNLNLKFNIQYNKNYFQIGEIKLEGEKVFLKGFIDISDKMTRYYFKNAHFGNDLFDIDISTSANKNIINIHAQYLDFSNFMDQLNLSTDEHSQTTDYQVTINVKKLILKNEVFATNFHLKFDCNDNFQCKNFDYSTKYNNQVESKAILKDNDLLLTSDNAEIFLKAFGLSEDFQGGNLQLHLIQPKENNGNVVGSITINDFSSKQTSIVVKLLLGLSSLASPSLTFADHGVKFKYCHADLKIMDKKIIFNDIKFRSSTVTITGNGVINLSDKDVLFKGKVAPKIYGLNKIAASIPLIGQVLSGNSENVIEASYTVSGKFGNIKTSINPLSILTIGFFKDLFN